MDINHCEKNIIENEIWKDININGFRNYQMSNLGNIRNKHVGKNLSQHLNKKNYLQVMLKNSITKKPKCWTIHRLVALTFIPNPNNYECVDHQNNFKNDNRVDNLRWVTREMNMDNMKHTKDQKIAQYDMNNSLIKVWNSIKKIVTELNYDKNAKKIIQQCCYGKQDTYDGFFWKFFIERNPEKRTIIYDLTNYKTIGQIDDYDFSNYKICQNPDIKIINKYNHLMIPRRTNEKDYYSIELQDAKSKRGVTLSIHRLIYAINNGNKMPRKGLAVDHINNDITANNIENLQLLTTKENTVKALGVKIKQLDPETLKVIKIYDSIGDACLGINHTDNSGLSNIVRACKTGMRAYNCRWEFVNNEEYNLNNILQEKKDKIKKIKQLDVETNEIIKIFDSINDAAMEIIRMNNLECTKETMKKYTSSIRRVYNGERNCSYGYKWEKQIDVHPTQ
jgi:hypothetical protein